MSDPSSSNHAASCAGVVRWRGWRLPFIDYEAWQHGHDLVFVLENEGELMLVPLTLNGRVAAPQQSIEGDEVRSALHGVQEWIDQGWLVARAVKHAVRTVGRLYTSFVGYETEGDFWRETYASLGMMPEARFVGRAATNRRRRKKHS